METINTKKKIASKMLIPTSVLAHLAHVGGKVGKAAAAIDSWQSRVFNRGKGVYRDYN